MGDCLSLLGLARRGGNLAVGELPVEEACKGKQARALLLAADAADNTGRKAARLAETGGIPLVPLPHSKAEIGFSLGRQVCALLAVTDTGLAAAVLGRLAEDDPAVYGDAAQRLAEQARQVILRQKERRERERGERKPWAAPPKDNRKGRES